MLSTAPSAGPSTSTSWRWTEWAWVCSRRRRVRCTRFCLLNLFGPVWQFIFQRTTEVRLKQFLHRNKLRDVNIAFKNEIEENSVKISFFFKTSNGKTQKNVFRYKTDPFDQRHLLFQVSLVSDKCGPGIHLFGQTVIFTFGRTVAAVRQPGGRERGADLQQFRLAGRPAWLQAHQRPQPEKDSVRHPRPGQPGSHRFSSGKSHGFQFLNRREVHNETPHQVSFRPVPENKEKNEI